MAHEQVENGHGIGNNGKLEFARALEAGTLGELAGPFGLAFELVFQFFQGGGIKGLNDFGDALTVNAGPVASILFCQRSVHVKAAQVDPAVGPQVLRQAIDEIVDQPYGLQEARYIATPEHAGQVREGDGAGKVGDHRDGVGQDIDDGLEGIKHLPDFSKDLACKPAEEITQIELDVVKGDPGLDFFRAKAPVQGKISADPREHGAAQQARHNVQVHVGRDAVVHIDDIAEAHTPEDVSQGEGIIVFIGILEINSELTDHSGGRIF